MKRKIVTLVLAVCLAASLFITGAASAAEPTVGGEIAQASLSSDNIPTRPVLQNAISGNLTNKLLTGSIANISIGDTVNASIDYSDYPYGDGTYYDLYAFTARAGQQIAINMSSANFGCWVELGDQNTWFALGFNGKIPAEGGFYTLPADGTYYIMANAFPPSPSYTGPYTLSLTGRPAVEDTATTCENTPFTIDVLYNDSGAGIYISAVTSPANGTANIMGDTILYTPNQGFYGEDQFTYTITDTKGDTFTANVAVTVHPTLDLSVEKSGPEIVSPCGQATYNYTVTNKNGCTAVTPVLSDDKCGDPTYVSGDDNYNGKIESGETWLYTASYSFSSADGTDFTNTVTVSDAEGIVEDSNLSNNTDDWTVCLAAWGYDRYKAVPFRVFGIRDCGWSNGPVKEGPSQLTLYAAIGNNNTGNSIPVGAVSVVYAEGKVKVKFNVDPAYDAQELRFYAGKKQLPLTRFGSMTNDPQQFPYSLKNGVEFTLPEKMRGDIFVAAYAVVCPSNPF